MRSRPSPARPTRAGDPADRPAPFRREEAGLEGIWQTHLALEAEGHNTDDDTIANFEDTDDCQGHWLRASVSPDGTFTMTNGRNGCSRTCTVR